MVVAKKSNAQMDQRRRPTRAEMFETTACDFGSVATADFEIGSMILSRSASSYLASNRKYASQQLALVDLLIDATREKAAIDYEYFTRHETGRFRSQKHCGAGQLFNFAEPFHRRPQQKLPAAFSFIQ